LPFPSFPNSAWERPPAKLRFARIFVPCGERSRGNQTRNGVSRFAFPNGVWEREENCLPDISFTAWSSLPTDTAHLKPIADYPPDLAVEVISFGDRPGELARKRREYFTAGTKLICVVDPDKKTVTVFTGPDDSTTLTEADTLTGGDVLPGFELPLAEYFDEQTLNPRHGE
jgi:Uma2 family endonuclease